MYYNPHLSFLLSNPLYDLNYILQLDCLIVIYQYDIPIQYKNMICKNYDITTLSTRLDFWYEA